MPDTASKVNLRLQQPWERILRCCARRGPRATITCEKEALHTQGSMASGLEHAGRDRRGRWHFWM